MKEKSVIKVNNITKIYNLYDKQIDRLKEAFNPFDGKYHKEFYALNNVSFDISQGESVGIIGKNGSGKSTLLKMITAVTKPSSGSVDVKGKISAILELGSGFNPEMTGLENIYLNTMINGMTKIETDSKISEIIKFSDLNEFINQPMKTYSSGMKARLAFSVAISADPDILIVDEALSVGDTAFRRKCYAKMESIRQRGATILFVSHSEASIVSLCNRAIWINNGEKILDGDPKLVTNLYMKNSNKKILNKELIEKEFFKLKNKIIDKSDNLNGLVSEYFDSSLISNTIINYEEYGAKISNTEITTLNGDKVNILIQGRDYIFSNTIDFYADFNNVKCGMTIKTLKGVQLGGGQYPYLNTLKGIVVKEGNCYKMQWKFKCNLVQGIYYMGSSVYCLEEHIQLHRLIDSNSFKVISNPKTKSAGSVDFIKEAWHEKI